MIAASADIALRAALLPAGIGILLWSRHHILRRDDVTVIAAAVLALGALVLLGGLAGDLVRDRAASEGQVLAGGLMVGTAVAVRWTARRRDRPGPLRLGPAMRMAPEAGAKDPDALPFLKAA